MDNQIRIILFIPQPDPHSFGVMRALGEATSNSQSQPRSFRSAQELFAFMAPMQPAVPPGFLQDVINQLKPGVGTELMVDRAWAESVGL
jgi:hypothetical protein